MIVERSAAGMNAMNRERSLQQSGEMHGGSNFGRGQMVSSDYGMSPEIVFSQDNTGGMGAALGGLIGGAAGAGIGGYSNTPQGKVVSAAFMDAYNQMVVVLRSYKPQSVSGQGLGGGGRLGIDGGAAPSQTSAPKSGASGSNIKKKQ